MFSYEELYICVKKNIPIAIERSQSGNGSSAWFFFNGRISTVQCLLREKAQCNSTLDVSIISKQERSSDL